MARQKGGMKEAREEARPGGPRWRYVPGGKGITYVADVVYERYQERLGKLLTLHEHSWVRSIVALAHGLYHADPLALLRRAADESQPLPPVGPDDALAAMLRDLRWVFAKRREEREGAYTWEDFAEEFLTVVPRIDVTYNWAPYDSGDRRAEGGDFSECRETEIAVEEFGLRALPADVPAFATIRIPVNHLSKWDVGQVVDAVKALLDDVLDNRPTYEEAPYMRGAIPRERAFLVHCREPEFERDVERLRLSLRLGLTNRQIAFLEHAESQGRAVDRTANPPLVDGQPIPTSFEVPSPGETAISEALERLVEALYLRGADRAQARRRSAPIELPHYECPKHGQDCLRVRSKEGEPTCHYFRTWTLRMEKACVLDSPEHGRLVGEEQMFPESTFEGLKKRGGVYRDPRSEDDMGLRVARTPVAREDTKAAATAREVLLRRALDELPEPLANVYRMLHVEGLPRPDVCAQLGLTADELSAAEAEAVEMVLEAKRGLERELGRDE